MSFCPEDRLLLACAGAAFRPDGSERVRGALREDLDWNYVLETSIRHAVSPLVYAALRETPPAGRLASVPRDVLGELKRLYDQTGVRNRRLYAVLAGIAESFHDAEVSALALKEIPMVLETYPDPALRPIGDIDLLIRDHDYNRAADALSALGFELVPQSEMPFTLKYATGHHFRRRNDEVWVDLQWNVADREWDLHGEGTFTFDPETLWDGASSLELTRGTFAVPRLEPMLLHLCLHAEGHEYGELVLFADIAALLAREGEALDSTALCHLARRYRAEASLYYVLLLSQRLLGARVSNELLNALEAPYVPAGMFRPIFGNLTQLHASLDEVRSLARPPTHVLDAMERVARRQAAGARELYKEVDAVVRGFIDDGGSVCVLDGARAERIFPDATLPPFGGLSIVVLEEDRARLARALADSGFEQQDGGPGTGGMYKKSREISSRDPVLEGTRTTLDIECQLESEWPGEHDPGEGHAKRHGALTVVKGRLRGWENDGERLRARLTFFTLPADEALVYLSSRLATEGEGRLFGLLMLLELFRGGSRSATALTQLSAGALTLRPAARESTCSGLAMVEEVLGSESLTRTFKAAGCSGQAPCVLEWARYGPSSLRRHGDLKRSFFVVYTLLSLKGVRERVRYLARAFVGGSDHGPFAHALLLDLVKVVVGAGRSKTQTTRDLAFWIETDRSAGN